MKVGLLTQEEKEQIEGQMFAPDSFYNPIQDIADNWIISTQEIDETEVIEFIWVKDLPLIDYQPKPSPDPF